MKRAFLVIDIQNEYFPNGALPLWQAEDIEVRIANAIGAARTAGDRVILIQHVSKAATGLFAADGTGVALRPAITKAAGDAPVVIKHSADSFQDTDLMMHLSDIDTVFICGMMTQNCVVFTALSRSADAFRVTVIGDLCTAPTEVIHRIALNALRSKIEVAAAADLWR